MYEPKITPWQITAHDFPHDGNLREQMKYLLQYAILAPSSHNTQPWKFSLGEHTIKFFIDKTRWLQVADNDQRELHISVGCALENLLIAAAHFGFSCNVNYFPDSKDQQLVAEVSLTPQGDVSQAFELFSALTARHTNHQVYESRPIPETAQQRLQECCVNDGISLYLTDDLGVKRNVDELMVRADAIEFSDPTFREELGFWVGQGAFGTSWFMSKIGQLAVTYVNMGKSTAKKDSEVLMSSPILGLICSQTNERVAQIKVGQTFERIYLISSILEMSLQPMSQVLQVPEVKAEMQKLLPNPTLFPQQPFRLGYAKPEAEHTPRRMLEEMLI
jgi:hypothetical protein